MSNQKEITKEAIDADMRFNTPLEHELQPAQKRELAPVNQGHMVQTQTDRFVEMALQSGDMNQLEKMLDLKERFDKEEARKSFTAALAEFKAEDMNIVKDRNVSFETTAGTTSYSHASLGNIVKHSVPVMSKHGLSHRWLTEQLDKGVVRVTCILTHKGGHSEQTSLQAAPDDSGKKNNIQRVSSTITYLERYTFLAITGLAVEEQDDDGITACPAEYITEDQQTVINDLIKEVDADNVKFLSYLGVVSIDQCEAKYYDRAIKALEAKRK